MKKVLIVTASIIALVFVSLILIPVIFKDQINDAVKKEINNQVDATVDWKGFSVSLFAHFPNITARMKGMSVVGKGVFENDTLVAFDKFEVTVDLMSLISGDKMEIRGIYLVA